MLMRLYGTVYAGQRIKIDALGSNQIWCRHWGVEKISQNTASNGFRIEKINWFGCYPTA